MRRPSAALGLVVLVLAAVVSGCWSVTPTRTPTPSPSPTPTPVPTASPTPSPTPVHTPTIDPFATPTPLPTGGPGAFYFVKKYEDYLLSFNIYGAWALLSQPTQARWGSVTKFETDRIAFVKKYGTEYQEELNPPNTLSISQWIEGRGWKIDVPNAHLVSVKWTAFSDPYKGWEIWIVNPTPTGWALYLAN